MPKPAYPRFSDAEIKRRREALDAAMAARDVTHVLVYGAERSGSAVGWLTRWLSSGRSGRARIPSPLLA